MGGALTLVDIQVKTEYSVDGGGDDTDTESNLKTQSIGPLAVYRDNNADRIVTFYGAFLLNTIKEETEDSSTETEVKYTSLSVGGSYHWHFIDRLAVGVGASYSFALNGEAEVGEDDGDYERTSLNLDLLHMLFTL